MTYRLTPDQSALWVEGGFCSWRIEEDVIEDLDRANVHEIVIVLLDTGAVAFAVTDQGVQL